MCGISTASQCFRSLNLSEIDSNEDAMHDPIMNRYGQHVLSHIVEELDENVTLSGNRDKIAMKSIILPS